MCAWVKYRAPDDPTVPTSYVKMMQWICDSCGNAEEETKVVYEPTDKIRIINRLLRLGDDYDFIRVSLASRPNEILLRIQTPDFDPSELRAIQEKQRETGFVNVAELLMLQKAGFRRPADVPPKPQPKDRATLRERARQRAFAGDPRPI
jgi:hypothetical protein